MGAFLDAKQGHCLLVDFLIILEGERLDLLNKLAKLRARLFDLSNLVLVLGLLAPKVSLELCQVLLKLRNFFIVAIFSICHRFVQSCVPLCEVLLSNLVHQLAKLSVIILSTVSHLSVDSDTFCFLL